MLKKSLTPTLSLRERELLHPFAEASIVNSNLL